MFNRENAVTAGWVVAGAVCVTMMQGHVWEDDGGVVSRGEPMERIRRLAGDENEYVGAMRSIGEIWKMSASETSNGMAGSTQMIITTVLILVLGSLAAGAGIGGGGLFVPIYMLLLGAGPKGAVPLSKATILGGAVGNFVSIGPAKHPKAKRPLIDYESSTLMQSGELLGVVFGVLLNNLLPAICIVTFLVLILSFNSYKTLKKAFAIRAKETKAMLKEKEAAAAAPPQVAADRDVEATPASPANTEEAKAESVDVQVKAENGAVVEGKKEEKAVSEEVQKILDEDAEQFPVWAWSLLMPMTAFTVAYSLVKNVIRNDENCTDAGFWTWYVTPVPVLGGFMWYTAVILGKRHKRKVDAGFEYLPADMQWDSATLKKFPFTALLAGVTAGLLGIGGGMVIGPLFLSIGMEPQVGTSSCAFMILWTAFSGVVIYGVDEHLGAQLALWCVAFGFVSGQIGQRLVNAILKKTGRPSYVVFLLGSIIGAACTAMAITLITKMAAGDYDANDVVEKDESVETHLFYLGSGFGCVEPDSKHHGNHSRF